MASRARTGIVSVLAASAFVVIAAPSRTAAADPKACIHAHSTGQRESKAGHLRLASQLFTSCGSDESCPDQLRKECAEFLDEVKRTIPTVVLSALDENGHDLPAAKVYSGDELLTDTLDGRALDIDPGRYHLRFVLPTGEELATDVVVREGEKQRLIQVKKERAASAERPPSGGELHGDVAQASSGRGAAPWVMAGMTVAALATGVTLGVLGATKKNDLDACKPDCPSSDRSSYDSAKTLFLGADIGFAAAIVGGAVTTWLFLSSPREAAPESKAVSGSGRVWLAGGPVPGGGSIGMAGRF